MLAKHLHTTHSPQMTDVYGQRRPWAGESQQPPREPSERLRGGGETEREQCVSGRSASSGDAVQPDTATGTVFSPHHVARIHACHDAHSHLRLEVPPDPPGHCCPLLRLIKLQRSRASVSLTYRQGRTLCPCCTPGRRRQSPPGAPRDGPFSAATPGS